jgi:hypothetical protein
MKCAASIQFSRKICATLRTQQPACRLLNAYFTYRLLHGSVLSGIADGLGGPEDEHVIQVSANFSNKEAE